MLSSVQEGHLQRTALCARLTLLELVEELSERQVPALSQEQPNAFCEGLQDCCVIFTPPLRSNANHVRCIGELLQVAS